ncbi:MAG: elongation factor 4 [Candidatus Levybacteria bacterium RIFCSPHIGHO2_02_FULL_40_18]|nr:MAG: elongation factor 4 [Candidatus Levybacteria bacterium RIFCSPHIGHO2_01_FULL_40_58]OGH26277.1 MAG: elongation factor 4 [Candidatus Levybacteria bacterium RIFCSPHIGHO2_02_FULL_40_18]OGH31236.1 MAG: elongation factor 4 [Candidatus Levybacteria bacterium RIFCSPHIGHO2_12_FULL_40_31]OGH39806.1 MAG: elongation factor 4 [Candidatus Levybacteria bacterium RIFCSPLOWO2_01_FULL_40_64]OGH49123.1 MAG: elongation factor 4 [Candidatus Levybacteria bacterium RIFCSPLOWO2_02_FULL_41_11]
MVRQDSPQVNQSNIRNFCIIAHVDHGKSTLADRLLEITGTVRKEELKEQFLDSSEISREHGITIKLAPVRMEYKVGGEVKSLGSQYSEGVGSLGKKSPTTTPINHTSSHNQTQNQTFVLNLIDTPGHVDFSYEVVRTLYACEGAILLVDATKGVQAQTVANYNFAKKLGLTIIPVINKIDLPTANIEKVENEIVSSFGFDKDSILKISAKTGEGVQELIRTVVERVPAPGGSSDSPTQALIFDSIYDEHRGIVIYVRLKNGRIKKGDKIAFASDGSKTLVNEVGYMRPLFSYSVELVNGEVGFIITNIKDITQAKVGDTILNEKGEGTSLGKYIEQKPFVYLSIYPTSISDFQNLRKALYRLKLNDAALSIAPEQSNIFGPGFRCGFLGLLHAQILIERIEREEGVEVFAAPPSIEYIVDGKSITNPKDFDLANHEVKEPYVLGEIYTPQEYLGSILELIHKRRGESSNVTYFGTQTKIEFTMPLANVIYDFYDKLKTLSSGFASFDYDVADFRESNLSRIDISVNNKTIPELSFVVHKNETESFSRRMVKALSLEIPRHQFEVFVRAQIGSRVVASERIMPFKKDVTAKLYGGDRTRKDKLLEAQKKGKKKMKKIGQVNVPKEAFLAVLKA